MLSPLLPWQPHLSYTTMATWAVCGAAELYVSICSCVWTYALPLGSLIQAGAPCTKWTLLMTIIKWQQGIGTQTLEKETKTQWTEDEGMFVLYKHVAKPQNNWRVLNWNVTSLFLENVFNLLFGGVTELLCSSSSFVLFFLHKNKKFWLYVGFKLPDHFWWLSGVSAGCCCVLIVKTKHEALGQLFFTSSNLYDKLT